QIEPTPPAPPPVELIAPETDSPPPSSEGFFQGLVRRVIEIVTPPKPPPDEALTGALAGAIAAMKLPTTPVAAVVEVHRGRAVRYDVENKRILVNASHDAVRALVKHPSRVLFL